MKEDIGVGWGNEMGEGQGVAVRGVEGFSLALTWARLSVSPLEDWLNGWPIISGWPSIRWPEEEEEFYKLRPANKTDHLCQSRQ